MSSLANPGTTTPPRPGHVSPVEPAELSPSPPATPPRPEPPSLAPDATPPPTSPTEAGEAGTPLSGRQRTSASSRSEAPTERARPATPHHYKHPTTLMKRIKSIGHRAKEIAGGSAPSTPSSGAFPRRLSSCRPKTAKIDEEEVGEDLKDQERPSIKIRLVTFNMHDNLPSGDLSEFLGEVKGWRRRTPSVSSARSSCAPPPEDDHDSIISVPMPAGLPQFPLTTGHPYHIIIVAGQECPTASGVLAGKIRTLDGLGWTSVLEHWLCGGPEDEDWSDSGDDSRSDSEGPAGGEESSMRSKGTSRGRGDGSGRGPYVLVEKERLLGIYISLFVARSCDELVKGTSKDRVAAGLIGGRLGNKGGVAISLSFAGSRLLFISAHLAAHASGLDVRKANVRKIFEELKVDDFTDQDPTGRFLTDRFDQTFLLGDLNMRLDLSRIHADWIAQSKDWATALAFDQLSQVLSEPEGCLKGFHEAPIHFAPTYKYDLGDKLKRKRSVVGLRSSKATKRTSRDAKAPAGAFSSISASTDATSQSGSAITASTTTTSSSATDENELRPPAKDTDSLSVISSQGSVSSAISDYDKIDRQDLESALGDPSLPDLTVDAVRRAQVRFLTLVRSNSVASASLSKRALGAATSGSRKLVSGALRSPPGSPTRPILRSSQSESGVRSPLASGVNSEEEDVDEDIPLVFDTSSKQRVQSYTDRILFRSTVGFGRDQDVELPPASVVGDPTEGAIPPTEAPAPAPDNHSPPLHHAYFNARPILESKKIHDPKTEKPWSDVASVSGEPVHTRFANWFGRGHRRGLAGRSTDSLALSGAESGTHQIRRAKSLHLTRRSSIAPSLAPSVATAASADARKAFWKRASATSIPTAVPSPSTPTTPFSVPGTGTDPPPPQTLSPTSSRDTVLSSPAGSPWYVDTPGTTPTSTLHKFFDIASPRSPSSSPTADRRVSIPDAPSSSTPQASSSIFRTPNLPRSLTRHSSRTGSGSSRIMSQFLHFFPPFPFFGGSREASIEVAAAPMPPPPEKRGPRKGEVLVLKYDAIMDLEFMRAVSDHRPVFAVVAIGVGEDGDETPTAA